MLQTLDKKNVFGDIRPIAYGERFTSDLQRQVYQKIRPGLTRELLQGLRDAYGFFALNEEAYIAAHFTLMELTEPTSRGKPVFSEYLYITADQLRQFEWNLLPIFKNFKTIDYYEQVNKNLNNLEVDIPVETDWLKDLREFSLPLQAALVRYLSSTEKISICSAPADNQTRLRFFCALLQIVPEKYRKNISFSTLASETNDSVKLFFSERQSRYGQAVNWIEPTIPTNKPGAGYVTWLDELITQNNQQQIKKTITTDLRLPDPAKSTHLKTWGDELDLAVQGVQWYQHREEFFRVRVPQKLNEQADLILKFSCIFSDQEVTDWLSTILTYLMMLNAYDIGAEALARHSSLLSQYQTRQNLVQKIVHFSLQSTESSITSLANFIIQVTDLANKTGQSTLIGFCKEILYFSLSNVQYQRGLNLWESLSTLSWTKSPEFISPAMDHIIGIDFPEELFLFLGKIGCPADNKVFTSLLDLLKRSRIRIHVPASIQFLIQLNTVLLPDYFENMHLCFQETESYGWLNTQINFAIQNYPDLVSNFPDFLANMPLSNTEKLLDYVVRIKDNRQIALISFAILLNGIRDNNSVSRGIFNKCISDCQNCNSNELRLSLPILQGHWNDFSKEQLLSIQNLLQQKLRGLDSNIQEIQIILDHYKRLDLISQKFIEGVAKQDLIGIIDEFIPTLIKATDVGAWQVLSNLTNSWVELRGEYREKLGTRFIENQAFGVSFYQLHKWRADLEGKGLLFEADLFSYWLIRMRDQKVNIGSVISRTLKSKSVDYLTAGRIIGYERAIDKTYLNFAVQRLLYVSRSETQSLGEELKQYVSKYPESFLPIKIRSWVEDIQPGVVWVEFCKTILSQIIFELQKAGKGRK